MPQDQRCVPRRMAEALPLRLFHFLRHGEHDVLVAAKLKVVAGDFIVELADAVRVLVAGYDILHASRYACVTSALRNTCTAQAVPPAVSASAILSGNIEPSGIPAPLTSRCCTPVLIQALGKVPEQCQGDLAKRPEFWYLLVPDPGRTAYKLRIRNAPLSLITLREAVYRMLEVLK